MTDLMVELRPGAGKRAQIEEHLRSAIRARRLEPGTRLPPSRVLAAQLGVSRGTVVDAYEQLIVEGYLEGLRGSGTRVSRARAAGPPSAVAPLPVRPVRIDLRSGLVDPAAFPRRAWQAATAQVLQTLPDADLVARHRGGYRPLRRALAGHLALSRAAVTSPDHVVVTAGLAYGISVTLEVLHEAGHRRVAIEDPGWPLHGAAARAAGMEVVPVPVDDQGIDVGALARSGSDVAIVTPAHQYPTGVAMGADRRAALIGWAQTHDGIVIEDDYDAEYRYDGDPVAALQSRAPGRVVHAGTVSKTLVPTLRLGWVALPETLALAVERRNARLGAWPSVLEQATLAHLIEHGQLQRHLRATWRRYRSRRDLLARELWAALDVEIGGAAAGLHLVAWLPDGTDEGAVIDEALRAGVALHGVHRHSTVVSDRRPGLLIGFGGCTDRDVRDAVRTLASLPSLAGVVRSRATSA